LLVSGVPIANVLYNFTGGTSTSHGSFDTHVGDVVDGTMLAPFYNMNLDGTWNGELIGGPLDLGLFSGAKVNGDSFNPPGPVVPEPSTVFTALSGLGLLGLVGGLRRLRRRSEVAPA
jgi:MYXO-CTERM domain-containing protein